MTILSVPIVDEEIHTTCVSEKVNGMHGYVVSPNYPNNYNVNTKCGTAIQSYDLSLLQLTILDLQLEPRLRKGCYDWLIVYGKENPTLSEVYCQVDKYLPWPQRTRQAVLKFKSDSRNSFRGFLIKFEGEQ